MVKIILATEICMHTNLIQTADFFIYQYAPVELPLMGREHTVSPPSWRHRLLTDRIKATGNHGNAIAPVRPSVCFHSVVGTD